MRTPLDISKDILTDKNQQELNQCDSFVPFLIQKYISSVSMVHCNLVNSIFNNRMKGWNDKQQMYNFLKCIIPKNPKARVNYIWPSKKEDIVKFDVGAVCETLEIPKKELQDLIKLFPTIMDDFIDSPEKMLKSIKNNRK